MHSIFIDNIQVDSDIITYNDGLNFNRFFKDTNIKKYKIQLTKEEFIEALEKEYLVARDEIKIDDEMHNETSDFKESRYCSFPELLDKPKYLYEIFNCYLRDIFFKHFLENKEAVYIINSIDSVKVNKLVEIKGKAFIKQN